MIQEKILIADDEPYVLDVCRRILERNYQVQIVNSGLEAIQVAQENRFDLLLTDIKMPGIDGLETAREIKKLHPDIVCITMTGFSTMETAIKALRLGVDEFVIKPFAPEELTLAIERALEKERLRKENIRLKSLLPLFEFNKLLMSTVDTYLLLQQVLDLAISETKSDNAILYTLTKENKLSRLLNSDISPDYLEDIETKSLILTEQLKIDQTQVLVQENVESTFNDILDALNIKSIVATPLLGKDKLLGVLLLLKKRHTFTQSECNFLSVMTSQAAVAYENARLFEDLQNAYDELKTLDHMKSEFINIAAHELRTPLAILMGYASVLEEDAEGIQKKHLGIILRNSLRLRALIEDLLNMRNIQSGQLSLTKSDVDINEIITQTVADVALITNEKSISLRTNLANNMPIIKSDKQKIELILTNLVANAIKFTPQNGEICIESKVDETTIEVSVSDTGIGIPEKEIPKIFRRFYQVENSLNREHDGIGLGLAIVEGMLERCGGKISVESELTKGSKFIFNLPITSS